MRPRETRLVVVLAADGRVDRVETEDGALVKGVVEARIGNTMQSRAPEVKLTVKRPRVRMET